MLNADQGSRSTMRRVWFLLIGVALLVFLVVHLGTGEILTMLAAVGWGLSGSCCCTWLISAPARLRCGCACHLPTRCPTRTMRYRSWAREARMETRPSVPQANPTIYVTLSLAITFPFNLIVGITSIMRQRKRSRAPGARHTMTQLGPKEKVEIVVEVARAVAIIDMVERAGAKGYTVVPNVNGNGAVGIRDAADLSDVFRNVLIVVIASEGGTARMVHGEQPLLENYAGIVPVSDVKVLRNEHF